MDTSETDHSLPVMLKREAAWDGIRLAHYRVGAVDLPEHSHQEHLVVISLSENCKGEINTASGFNARCQSKGSVCVVPSGKPMTVRTEGESEHLAIYLEPSLVLHAASELRGAARIEVVEKSFPSDPVISNVGMALLAELDSEGLGGRLYRESLANVMAVHLLRHYTVSRDGAQRFTGGLSGQRLRLVMAFIADNYEHDVSLAELARVAGMSTFHFAREFKRTTGTTPHQYLIKFRIDRAKALLAESKIPLVDVSTQSGFSHQSHFTRLFRKLTGTTPQSYRLMFQT
jgi:AraC family transcriptional regulator